MKEKIDLQRVWEYKGRIINLTAEDIYYICSEQRKTYVHTRNRVYQIGTTLKIEEEKLQGLPFIRTHRAYLIHMKYLESIGRQEVVLRNGDKIPVSEQRAGQAKQQVRRYLEAWKFTKKNGKSTRINCGCPRCLNKTERCDMVM